MYKLGYVKKTSNKLQNKSKIAKIMHDNIEVSVYNILKIITLSKIRYFLVLKGNQEVQMWSVILLVIVSREFNESL